MELKFKKLTETAVIPAYAHKGDAGLDLTCDSVTTVINEAGQLIIMYHTGLAVEIPEGYVGLLFARSSIFKKSIVPTNCVGVIDSGYRGEVMFAMKTTTDVVPAVYQQGERFAQLVIMPLPEFTPVEAEELSESERGEGGYGSTDTTVEDNSTENNEPKADTEAA